MTGFDHLRSVVEKISVGKLYPEMKIQATISADSQQERVAVLITYPAHDAVIPDNGVIGLSGCSPVPAELLDPFRKRDLLAWIRERIQDELLHELDEFLKYDGRPIYQAKHPQEIYDAVRTRNTLTCSR